MPSRPSTAAGSRAPPKSLEVKGKGGQPVASKSSLSRLERLKRHQEIIRRCSNELGICLEGAVTSSIDAPPSDPNPPQEKQPVTKQFQDDDIFSVLPHFGDEIFQHHTLNQTAESSNVVSASDSLLFPDGEKSRTKSRTSHSRSQSSNKENVIENKEKDPHSNTNVEKEYVQNDYTDNEKEEKRKEEQIEKETAIEVATRLVAKFARSAKEESVLAQNSISASPEYEKKENKKKVSHLSGSVEGILKKWRNKYDEFLNEPEVSMVSNTSDESSRQFDPEDVFREDPALVIQRIKQRLGITAPAPADDLFPDSPDQKITVRATSSNQPHSDVQGEKNVSEKSSNKVTVTSTVVQTELIEDKKDSIISEQQHSPERLPPEQQHHSRKDDDTKNDRKPSKSSSQENEIVDSSTLDTPSFSEESNAQIHKTETPLYMNATNLQNKNRYDDKNVNRCSLPDVLQEIRKEDIELRLSTDELHQQLQGLEPSPNPSSIHPPHPEMGGSRPITPFNADMSCATSVSWISNHDPISSQELINNHDTASSSKVPPLPLPLQNFESLSNNSLSNKNRNVMDSLSLSMDTVSVSASKDWYAQDDRMPPHFLQSRSMESRSIGSRSLDRPSLELQMDSPSPDTVPVADLQHQNLIQNQNVATSADDLVVTGMNDSQLQNLDHHHLDTNNRNITHERNLERNLSEEKVQPENNAVVVEKSECAVQCEDDLIVPVVKEVSTVSCQTSPRLIEEFTISKCDTIESGVQAETTSVQVEKSDVAIGTHDIGTGTDSTNLESQSANVEVGTRENNIVPTDSNIQQAPPRPPRSFSSTNQESIAPPLSGLSAEVVQTALRSMLAPDRPPTYRSDLTRHHSNPSYYRKPSPINWPRDLSQPYPSSSTNPLYPRSQSSSQPSSRPWSRSQSPYLRYPRSDPQQPPPQQLSQTAPQQFGSWPSEPLIQQQQPPPPLPPPQQQQQTIPTAPPPITPLYFF